MVFSIETRMGTVARSVVPRALYSKAVEKYVKSMIICASPSLDVGFNAADALDALDVSQHCSRGVRGRRRLHHAHGRRLPACGLQHALYVRC